MLINNVIIIKFYYHLVYCAGKVKTENSSFKGTLEIPNLSEEHEPDDVDINVLLKEGQEEGHHVKEFLRTEGAKVIREKLSVYIKTLKEGFICITYRHLYKTRGSLINTINI